MHIDIHWIKEKIQRHEGHIASDKSYKQIQI
jgi:hypothetical protein